MNLDLVVADIKRDEGWREFAYDDGTGKPVVRGDTMRGYVSLGWGFCISADRGRPLPREIADRWLDQIIAETCVALDYRIPWWRTQPGEVQRALVSMAYQLGVSGLLNFRRMLAALERGDRYEAAVEALDSRWANQTRARAERIAAMIGGSHA